MFTVEQLGKNAKIAEMALRSLSAVKKNSALTAIQKSLIMPENMTEILAQNSLDLDNYAKSDGNEVMADRLRITEDRIFSIAQAVGKLVELADPTGEIIGGGIRPNGIKITKIRVPMGVIGIIYESRPNVTVDAAALCLKSGNCAILRGGKEAINTNKAFAKIMRKAVENAGLPADVIQLVEDTSRQSANELMKLNKYLDLLIPRGGAGLINAVVQNATVPVIETGTGNCHLYVDENADFDMALSIAINGKTQRPSVCNALESLLVHKNSAKGFFPIFKEKFEALGVEIRGCEETRKFIDVKSATIEDFETEFLDLIISVKVVSDIGEAIAHVNRYGTKHSECIVTNSYLNAQKFQLEVDAAAVYVNASTRFTDGGEFGLGAEIGISTQKLHARGPMGLAELTTYKYLVCGQGQVRN